MKYKYSRKWFALEIGLSFLLCFVANILLYLFTEKEDLFIQNNILCATFILFYMLTFSNEYFKRYVEFFDESIRFNSFRIAGARKVLSFNFKYGDITSIKASWLPVIGVWNIKVGCQGFAYPIPISFCFVDYMELCEKLCDVVKENNPDAYIDGRIVEFIERKKKDERN